MASYEILSETAPEASAEILVTTKDGRDVNVLQTPEGISVISRRQGLCGPAPCMNILHGHSVDHDTIPYGQVLRAEAYIADNQLRLRLSALTTLKDTHSLFSIDGYVHSASEAVLKAWCEETNARAYPGTRARRMLVVVNPKGGKGHAREIWERRVRPVFDASFATYTVMFTEAAGSKLSAVNIARDLDLSTIDLIVPVSGDGILHQMLNGFGQRPDAATALATPFAPIPAGSGNAASTYIAGPARVDDIEWLALSALKGEEFPIDICSLTQGGVRTFSFLSQAFGLMADLDLGTEHLRFLGDTRFVYGFLRGALTRKTYPVEITLKVVESDKLTMAHTFNTHRTDTAEELHANLCPAVREVMDGAGGGVELQFGTDLDELPRGEVHEGLPDSLTPGWHTLKSDVFYFYAGKFPFVSRDVQVFPTAHPDGLIDVEVVPPISRMTALGVMDGAELGKAYTLPHIKYYKCQVYRLTPLSKDGYISIDGEKIDYKPFQVEVHPHLGRFVSVEGKMFSTHFNPSTV